MMVQKPTEAPLFPFWIEDRGLSFFFGFLVFITIFVPMVRLSRSGRIALDLLFAIMLFSGAIATIRHRFLMYLVIAVTALEFTGDLIVEFNPWLGHRGWDTALKISGMAILVVMTLKHTFRPGPISVHRVMGGGAAYLLIGLTWAFGYKLLMETRPDAIHFGCRPSVRRRVSTMENDSMKDRFSRRGFLGVGSAALATVAGSLAVSSTFAQENPAIKIGTDRSATDPGPSNDPLDKQNPDSEWPPATDSKSLVQNFKYPFSFANKRTYKGGWSREVTVRELPVSKDLAGVNMRLTAGGVRELHWHTADEWAIVLYGSARITAIDREGKSFVADVKKDELWYFPSGIPHSIQGLEPDGTEFMLVFDDGNFSESETVLLSDAMAHVPPEVLS